MIAQPLNIALIQCELHWEQPSRNLSMLDELLQEVSADVIIMPEMFTTGFSMNTELANDADSAISWMHAKAEAMDAAICGSIMFNNGKACFNRLHWVTPGGNISTYDKRHLFTFADEDQHFSPGDDRLIVTYKGWRICPLVCYDLRFPVWSRNADLHGGQDESVYDLLIYVANWPEARRTAWEHLLLARAHENQCYVTGVNRVGKDGKNIRYSGDSAIISPKGEYIQHSEKAEPKVLTATLSMTDLEAFRAKFPVGRDKDPFQLR